MRGNFNTRRLELILFGIGTVAAVLFTLLSVPAILARSAAPQTSTAIEQVFPPGSLGSAYMAGAATVPLSSVLGSVKIPALRIDAPLIEGVADGDLLKGVGHVPTSAMAGGLGNMVLAAHRDRIFRPLRDIQKNMEIQIVEGEATFHYRVDSWQVVSPDRIDVMAIASQPQVTLITCYPFNFVGSAPMRFVVKAHLVSAVPDEPAVRD